MRTRNGSVVRRLQLGRALRELREAAGLNLEVAALRLDRSSSKLSRIENGQQSVDVHGVHSGPQRRPVAQEQLQYRQR